ncbi:hypothetical protein NH340_JMT09110 [Sarcoptes scabiei]|nr:hypothetical protein NH340_JMT09110 [Sarcoptes scabiei]
MFALNSKLISIGENLFTLIVMWLFVLIFEAQINTSGMMTIASTMKVIANTLPKQQPSYSKMLSALTTVRPRNSDFLKVYDDDQLATPIFEKKSDADYLVLSRMQRHANRPPPKE